MQESIEDKVNVLGQYFVGLLLGQRLAKIAPFRWCDEFGAQTIDASAHDPPLMPSRTPLLTRYRPIGTWPALMRADMAAADMDYRNTGELARAVVRGEVPPPTGYHGTWARSRASLVEGCY